MASFTRTGIPCAINDSRRHRLPRRSGHPIGDVMSATAQYRGDQAEVLAAGKDQTHGAELVHGRNQGRRAATAGSLLHHDASGHAVGALTAVGLGDVDSVEAGLVEGVEGFLRESLPLAAVSCVRDDVAFSQRANRGAQFLVRRAG